MTTIIPAEETIESLQCQIMNLRTELTKCEMALVEKILTEIKANGQHAVKYSMMGEYAIKLLENAGCLVDYTMMGDGMVIVRKGD